MGVLKGPGRPWSGVLDIWEGPREVRERPWELLKGLWAGTWGFGGGPGRVPGPSGVSWEALEGPPEASWEGPREVPERPWELLEGPWGSRWRLGRSWGARGAYLEGSWKARFSVFWEVNLHTV